MPPPLLFKLEKKFVRKYRGKMEYEYSAIYKGQIVATRKSTRIYIGGYIEKTDDKYTISFMFQSFHRLVASTYKCAGIYAVAVMPEYEKMVLDRMLINIIQTQS